MLRPRSVLLKASTGFSTADQLVDYMRACVRDEVIHRKAKLKGPEGSAMRLARDWITRQRQDGFTLSLDITDKAIKMAEDYRLREMQNSEHEDVKGLSTEVQDETQSEEADRDSSQSDKPRFKAMRTRIRKLTAQVAQWKNKAGRLDRGAPKKKVQFQRSSQDQPRCSLCNSHHAGADSNPPVCFQWEHKVMDAE